MRFPTVIVTLAICVIATASVADWTPVMRESQIASANDSNHFAKDDCPHCKGKGRLDCSECKGKGKDECNHCKGKGEKNGKKCGHCKATGRIDCKHCKGTGRHECKHCKGTGKK